MGLRASNTSSREGEGAMEKTVILETSRTKESLVRVESLGTRKRGNIRTERRERIICISEERERER